MAGRGNLAPTRAHAPSSRPTPPPRRTPGNTPAYSPARRPGRGRPSGGTAPPCPGRRRPRPAPGCRVGRAGWSGPGGRAPSRPRERGQRGAVVVSLGHDVAPPSTALINASPCCQQQLRPLRRHLLDLEIAFQQLRRGQRLHRDRAQALALGPLDLLLQRGDEVRAFQRPDDLPLDQQRLPAPGAASRSRARPSPTDRRAP